MSAPTLKEATDTDPGTAEKYGAPDVVEMAQLLMGTHPTEIIQENAIKNVAMALGTGSQVVTGSKIFNSTTLKLNNPATTFQYTFVTSALAGNINVTMPLLVASDTFVFANFIQTLTNKTLDAGSNTISNLVNANIAAAAAIRVTKLQAATADYIADENGNEQIKFVTTSSAVNEITITNAATGNMAKISASGETNIGLLLTGNGTGLVTIGNAADNTKTAAFSLVGATTGKKTTLTFVHTDNRAITFPDFDATLSTLAGTETLSGKTLTAPKIASGGFIADANGNELIIFTTTASAVNELTYANAATGNWPTLTASGETNVGFKFVPKGTGYGYGFIESIEVALSDDAATSVPTTGVKYTSLPMQADFKVIGLPVAGVKTAGTGATLVEVDILVEDSVNANTFTTIFSTRPTIDASEFTSTTAATPPVLSATPTTIAKGKRVQYKIQAVDSNNLVRGMKVGMRGYYSAA